MAYTTIQVHADLSLHAPSRIAFAAALAQAHGARLVGVAMTGISRFTSPSASELARTAIGGYVDVLYAHAQQALAQFEAVARAHGAGNSETRLVADDHENGLIQQSRFCDLLVLSQADPAHATPEVVGDLPERVMLAASRPVLVVPHMGNTAGADGPALVAWDGSREATHAVTGAVPLLQRASRVVVAHFDAPESAPRDAQAQELLAWLAGHGITAGLEERPACRDVGSALLALAAEQQAALVVMGGYGHPRFRELLLGGVTRHVLKQATVPVLVSH